MFIEHSTMNSFRLCVHTTIKINATVKSNGFIVDVELINGDNIMM